MAAEKNPHRELLQVSTRAAKASKIRRALVTACRIASVPQALSEHAGRVHDSFCDLTSSGSVSGEFAAAELGPGVSCILAWAFNPPYPSQTTTPPWR